MLKKILVAIGLGVLPAAAAWAQTAPVAAPPASLATVSGTAQDPLALAAAAEASIPAGAWAGKLDTTKDFSVGGWQSLKSADEAYGVSKPIWSLQKGGQPLLNVGIFAGIDKPLVPLASSAPKFLGGATISVPGSTLDWALGTNMGAMWVPRLKTGVLYAQDFTRPKAMTWGSGFVGVGASYPLF